VAGSKAILYQFSRTDGSLLSENDLHKGQTADYIYLNGRPIGEVNPTTGSLYFTHTDRLGTPQKLTDSTQAVAWSALYQPFGGTGTSVTGTLATQSLRFPGQQFDPETGLYHNGFRDYSPALGRYVESDPIGLAGGLNTYEYTRANPLKHIDESGEDIDKTMRIIYCLYQIASCPTFDPATYNFTPIPERPTLQTQAPEPHEQLDDLPSLEELREKMCLPPNGKMRVPPPSSEPPPWWIKRVLAPLLDILMDFYPELFIIGDPTHQST
jgi:RHS repeat-associated protein